LYCRERVGCSKIRSRQPAPCESVEPGNSEEDARGERVGHSVRTHKNVHTYSSRLAHAPAQRSAEGRRIERPSLMMTPGFRTQCNHSAVPSAGGEHGESNPLISYENPFFRQTSVFPPGPLSVELSNNDSIQVGPVRVEAARELLWQQQCMPIPPRA
jgi:hypothetical protein